MRHGAAAGALVPLLRDASPRVRFFAAEALGRIRHRPAVQPIVEMLAANNDEDVYLRHAGAMALSRIGASEPLAALAGHQNEAVRIAAVVALRRMRDPGVARFLADQDEFVVTEAARAINDDGGIEGALPALAAALDGKVAGEPFVRRAINANLRVGTAEAAKRVSAYAARATVNDEMRAEAIAMLGVWPKPSVLDRVDGTSLGPVQRDTAIARDALAANVEPLFTNGSTAVQVALANAVGRLRLQAAAPLVYAKVGSGATPEVRIAALRALAMLGDARTARGGAHRARGQGGHGAHGGTLRHSAAQPSRGDDCGAAVHGDRQGQRRRAAERAGVAGSDPRHDRERITDASRRPVGAGQARAGDPARRRRGGQGRRRTQRSSRDSTRWRRAGRTRSPSSPTPTRCCGGNARRGQQVIQAPAAQCTRCHNFGRGAAVNVGPTLVGVGGKLTREQLLEALVDPSARIAPGFGVVQVTLKNGEKYFGTLKEETDSHIVVDVSPTSRRIAKRDIAERNERDVADAGDGEHPLAARDSRRRGVSQLAEVARVGTACAAGRGRRGRAWRSRLPDGVRAPILEGGRSCRTPIVSARLTTTGTTTTRSCRKCQPSEQRV